MLGKTNAASGGKGKYITGSFKSSAAYNTYQTTYDITGVDFEPRAIIVVRTVHYSGSDSNYYSPAIWWYGVIDVEGGSRYGLASDPHTSGGGIQWCSNFTPAYTHSGTTLTISGFNFAGGGGSFSRATSGIFNYFIYG